MSPLSAVLLLVMTTWLVIGVAQEQLGHIHLPAPGPRVVYVLPGNDPDPGTLCQRVFAAAAAQGRPLDTCVLVTPRHP